MGFTDPRDPTAHLTAPAERSESIWGQPFSHPGTVFDWFELGAKAKLIISTAYNTINLLAGEIQTLSADTGALTRYPLPGAYQHPANAKPL